MSWFKSKRGGGDKREAKEVPTMLKETFEKWAGKGKKVKEADGEQKKER